MANLASIRPHYLSLPEPLRRQFVSDYRDKRRLDLLSTREEKPPKEAKTKAPEVQLTDEEKALAKKLGISMKQIRQLRSQL